MLETLRLSNGDTIVIDPDKSSARTWRPELARAIMMRFLRESARPKDRSGMAWHLEVIPEEIKYLLATTELHIKDLILYTIFFEDFIKLYHQIEKEASRREGPTSPQ